MSRRWGRGYCGALLICTLDALELPFRFSRCSSGTEAALGHFFVVVFCSPVLAYFKLLFIVITLPSASTSTSTSLRPLPRPRSRSVLAKLMATLIYYHKVSPLRNRIVSGTACATALKLFSFLSFYFHLILFSAAIGARIQLIRAVRVTR